MPKKLSNTMVVRLVSVGFSMLALGVFMPFGLDAWRWEGYLHLAFIGMLGVGVCMVTEGLLKYAVGMPCDTGRGIEYIIRRNLWFQFINTPLVSLMICLYRHLVLSVRDDANILSWSNFMETLFIMAFCSFTIGQFWRFKFRSQFMAEEMIKIKEINKQLSQQGEQSTKIVLDDIKQKKDEYITLTGSTRNKVEVNIADLMYIESVGNYAKVCHREGNEFRSEMIRATSKQMEETLKGYVKIVRCHRAFLVNLEQVCGLRTTHGGCHLEMSDGKIMVPVSRSKLGQIKKALTSGILQ